MKKFYLSVLGALAISGSYLSFGMGLEAIAAPKQLNLTISTKQNQSFSSLLKEAETLASTSIKQSFQSDKGATDIAVYVLGERNGLMVPLISVVVSQSDWLKNPDIKSWIRYLPSTEILLGFVGSNTNTQIARSTSAPSTQLAAVRALYPSENEPNYYQ